MPTVLTGNHFDSLAPARSAFGPSRPCRDSPARSIHLVVETPRANLVPGMKWLLGTYTMRLNRRHKLTGYLFAGRYKSLLIDETKPNYLRAVCNYVHLNPVRAKLLPRQEQLEKYVWSSYPSYLRSARQRETWLRCDRLIGEHGLGLRNLPPFEKRELRQGAQRHEQ
jgi:hypothetical protein